MATTRITYLIDGPSGGQADLAVPWIGISSLLVYDPRLEFTFGDLLGSLGACSALDSSYEAVVVRGSWPSLTRKKTISQAELRGAGVRDLLASDEKARPAERSDLLSEDAAMGAREQALASFGDALAMLVEQGRDEEASAVKRRLDA